MSTVNPNPTTRSCSPSESEASPRAGQVEPMLPFHIRPEIAEAQRAFAEALPVLLQERPGQWVAYHGSRQLGFAASKTELYQACLRQGLPRGQFLVRCIEPQPDILSFGLSDVG